MTKKEALNIVFAAARNYKDNLVGKSLLFIYLDDENNIGLIETIFSASNFLHMTGLRFNKEKKSNLFFELCLNKRLSINDFEFAANGTTPLKLQVLPYLVTGNLSAKMIGTFSGNNYLLTTDKLIGSTVGCIGFIKSNSNGLYVPNTVLQGDIRNMVYKNKRIILTYSKSAVEKEYSDIVYAAHKYNFNDLELPAEYRYLPLPEKG